MWDTAGLCLVGAGVVLVMGVAAAVPLLALSRARTEPPKAVTV